MFPKQQNQSHNSGKKGKRKVQYCDLEGQDDTTCDYEVNGASIVTDRVTVPESSKHLNLVGKALCRRHYNKLIVNTKKNKKSKKTNTNSCRHPKHETYAATARTGKGANTFRKVPERLGALFKSGKDAMMCRHCLYKTDQDPEYISSPDYLPPIEKTNIQTFQGRAYVLRGDVIYSEAELQELESAYHEVCAELDETKLRKWITTYSITAAYLV